MAARKGNAPATDLGSGPAIETLSLVKTYGSVVALAGLSMTVARGEIFGFLGPNGAGKTTAVKILLGLAQATAGEGEVLGAPLGDLEVRRCIGYLPELFRYQDWLTAREVLLLHCALAGVPRARRAAEVDEALETVGLTTRAGSRVVEFSKGMQQRLGLGVALIGKPALVVLDEPTSALDPIGRHDVRAIVLALKHRGATVFLNSHLLTEVEKVCDRVAIIDRGRIIAQDRLDKLLGAEDEVRLRFTSISPEAQAVCSAFGSVSTADSWVTIRGVVRDRVPDLVTRLVQVGARVEAVEPARRTLEETFMQLLGSNEHADHDRITHSA